MRILTMLGTGNYKPITYVWEEHRCNTSLFPIALTEWQQPSDVYMLLTKKAKETEHWREIQSQLSGKTNLHPVDIPDGANETELWAIFNSLDILIREGPDEETVIDITHGFRSLPVLTLLAVAFLRSAKGLNVSHILYGAYDARNEDTGLAPVFDLTPFLDLLDWSNAADRFNDTGDSSKIARLLAARNRGIFTANGSENGPRPRELGNISKQMESLSLSLALTLPREVLRKADIMLERLESAREETRFSPPFDAIFDRIERTYRPLAVKDGAEAMEVLEGEWRLINWYRDSEQWIPMITLAREWIVSATCHLNGFALYDKDSRKMAEHGLYGSTELNITPAKEKTELIELETLSLDIPEIVSKTWRNLTQFRNEAAHCGMNEQPIPADRLRSNIENTLESLRLCADIFFKNRD